MTFFRKNKLLSFALAFSVFIILFPVFVSAVTYTTPCNENKTIGSCSSICCATACCAWDEEGGCTQTCCVSSCTQCSCSGEWTEYRCATAVCGSDIWERTCQSVCTPGSNCCSCGGCTANCTEWQLKEKAESWHKCEGTKPTSWCFRLPQTRCQGECIDVPTNDRYYDNPNYPLNRFNPEPSKGSDNVYLPLKLDWDEVRGWHNDWQESNQIKTCSEKCVNSYVIRIASPANLTLNSPVLTESEYNPNEDNGQCFLSPNIDYSWHVKACCNINGTNCGPESDWNFYTNSAPELKSPYDPDWAGPKKAEELSREEVQVLRWCKIEDEYLYEEAATYRPLSYKILIYHLEEDLCHPDLMLAGECQPKVLSPDIVRREELPPDEFWDKYGLFTKQTPYAWQVAACQDTEARECSDYSQLWRFETADWPLNIILIAPINDKEKPIGLPAALSWVADANSFNYELIGVDSDKTKATSVAFDYPQLKLDTVYGWRAQACWDYDSKECEEWPEVHYFRTTGRPPHLIYPKEDDIQIPVNFKWEAVGGANSYIFKIQGPGLDLEKVTEKPEFILDYPELKQETSYSWQVKTCARKDGTVCGEFSSVQAFTTFKLSTPVNLKPEDGSEVYTYEPFYALSWEPVAGAKFYQFEIVYAKINPEDPKTDECQELVGKKIISSPNNIVSRTSVSVPLKCWGEYQWQVKACLDEKCEESGDYGPVWTFGFVAEEAPPGIRGWGLVPCGRTTFDPDTPWLDETEPCQIKHLFVMLFLLIDFLLWKLVPLVLVLLVLASGIIFYFSAKMEAPNPIAKVKSLWKAAGMGLGIIFLAWIIVSFFLNLFGYRVGVFGPWWQIIF